MSTNKGPITRFPPSPTGFLHIGRARTALFNFLYSKKHGGKLLFRIEDTDKARSKKEYEENIIECLEWLGIKYDNKEILHQSERTALYSSYIQKMIDSGKAYVSKEDNPEDGKRGEVIRFKNPNIKLTFQDLIRGEISFDTTELKDFVIAKGIDEPLYHMAVVVDDFEMGVTHIIRGDDGISNTPRQILIQEAIGAPRPIYAHIPLILAPDKSKLSGRHGAVAVTEYREKGYLPEALINYLALLGWNPGTEQEIFTMAELEKHFDLDRVQKSGAIFNEVKLRWINKEHMRKLSQADVHMHINTFLKKGIETHNKHWKLSEDLLQKIIPVILERIETFGDVTDMVENEELDYFFDTPSFEPKDLIWKGEEGKENTVQYFEHVIKLLESASNEDFSNVEAIKNIVWGYATEKGKGNVLWPIRFALTGKSKSPDPFVVMVILGKEESLQRLMTAQKVLAKSK